MSRASASVVLVLLMACASADHDVLDEPFQGPAVNQTEAPFLRVEVPESVRLEGAGFPSAEVGRAIAVCEGMEETQCGSCDAGFVCGDAFCAGTACTPQRPCATATDCGAGSCVEGSCSTQARCRDHGECAYGFACEAGACVDRRIPCGAHEAGCPRGTACTFLPVEGLPFCVPSQQRCTGDAGCEPGARCTQLEDSGEFVCVPAGLCSKHEDCPTGLSCGLDPGTAQSSCVADGGCRQGACPVGFECLDAGRSTRCVAAGATCRSDSDCPPRHLCGAWSADEAPHCITYDSRGAP